MYCKNCGNQLPEGAKFCDSCGCPTERRETNSKKPKRTGVKALLVFCVVALILGGAGTTVYLMSGNVGETIENQEEKPADQMEEPESAERIYIACGLGMEWEEFNREVIQEEFERKVYNGVDWCMENQEKGITCSLTDEDDDTIWLIELVGVETQYCIEGIYIGQELSKGSKELEERNFVFGYDEKLDEEGKALYDNKYDYISTYRKGKEEVMLFVKEEKICAVGMGGFNL